MATCHRTWRLLVILTAICVVLHAIPGIQAQLDCPDDCLCLGPSFTCQISPNDGLSLNSLPPELEALTIMSDDTTSLSADNFTGFPNLVTLNIISRSLSNIEPGTFRPLADLIELGIFSATGLQEITTDVVRDLVKLEILRIEGTSVESIEDGALQNLPNLRELSLQGSRLNALTNNTVAGLNTLTSLKLQANLMQSLSPDALVDLDNLLSLTLHSNRLENLPSDVFRDLTTLEELYLQSNNIGNLDVSIFNSLTSLRILDLSDNNINNFTPLQELFSGLSKLEELDLASNSLSSLPDRLFEDLTSLGSLNLESNNIVALSSLVFGANTNIPDTAVINLRLNPLDCNCELDWLIPNEGSSSATCASPASLSGSIVSSLDASELKCITYGLQGRDIFLTCPSASDPAWRVAWMLPSGQLLSVGQGIEQFNVTEEGELQILNVATDAEGDYRCYVVNIDQVIIASDLLTLMILLPDNDTTTTSPSSSMVTETSSRRTDPSSEEGTTESPVTEPSTTRGSETIVLLPSEGGVLVLPFQVTDDDFVIRWITPDGMILFRNDTAGLYTVTSSGSLVISLITNDNVGTYVVSVTDMSGIQVEFRVITVQLAPNISISTESIVSRETTDSGVSEINFTREPARSTGRSIVDTVSYTETSSSASTTFGTTRNVDTDVYRITVSAVQRVELSPQYPDMEGLTVTWVTPQGVSLVVNQTSGSFSVSEDGFLIINPLVDSHLGVYTVLITDIDDVVLDLNIIHLERAFPTSATPLRSTADPMTSEIIGTLVDTEETPTTFPSSPEMTTQIAEEPTTIKLVTDRNTFIVQVELGVLVMLLPRYSLESDFSVFWVTSDGIGLPLNATSGAYTVLPDGTLSIQNFSNTNLGTYIVTITDGQGRLVDQNVILVTLSVPTTMTSEGVTNIPSEFTTLNLDQTSVAITNGVTSGPETVTGTDSLLTSEITVRPTDANDRTSPIPERSTVTEEVNKTPTLEPTSLQPSTKVEIVDPTSEMLPTTVDQDVFDVTLTQLINAVLAPRYAFSADISITWVTPDGITLQIGESEGPYNVTEDGRLIIEPIADTSLGTYIVSVADRDNTLLDLNVIRVQFEEPISTIANEVTSGPQTVTGTNTLLTSEITVRPTDANDRTSPIPERSTVTEEVNKTPTLGPISTITNGVTSGPETVTGTDILLTSEISVRPTDANDRTSPIPERSTVTEEVNKTPNLEPTSLQSSATVETLDPTSEMLPTTEDQDIFDVILTQLVNVVLAPRYAFSADIRITWITPDGITLQIGESDGPYNVTEDGRLIIEPIADISLGTYIVSVADNDNTLLDLNVIRVQFEEPIFSIANEVTTGPQAVTGTDSLLTSEISVKLTGSSDLTSPISDEITVTEDVNKTPTLGPISTITNGVTSGPETVTGTDSLLTSEISVRPTDSDDRTSTIPERSTVTEEVNKTPTLEPTSLQPSTKVGTFDPTSERLPTTEDQDIFDVTITQLVNAVLAPRYASTADIRITWFTPDGISLQIGESNGPYNVTEDGRLVIEPIADISLGTYIVSVADIDNTLLDLNVIRVRFEEPISTISNEVTSRPQTVTMTDSLLTTEVSVKPTGSSDLTSLIFDQSTVTEDVNKTPTLGPISTITNGVSSGPETVTGTDSLLTSEISVRPTDANDRTSPIPERSTVTEEVNKTPNLEPTSLQPSTKVETVDPTSEMLPTTVDQDVFDVTLTQLVNVVLAPRYAFSEDISITWVTPDGVTLQTGESNGRYNVTDDGQLIIDPIDVAALGTFTVSVTSMNGVLLDLNVIRVQFEEFTSTITNTATLGFETVTGTDTVLTTEMSGAPTIISGLTSPVPEVSPLTAVSVEQTSRLTPGSGKPTVTGTISMTDGPTMSMSTITDQTESPSESASTGATEVSTVGLSTISMASQGTSATALNTQDPLTTGVASTMNMKTERRTSAVTEQFTSTNALSSTNGIPSEQAETTSRRVPTEPGRSTDETMTRLVTEARATVEVTPDRSLPGYLIPLVVAIALVGVAFLLILLAVSLTTCGIERNYGVSDEEAPKDSNGDARAGKQDQEVQYDRVNEGFQPEGNMYTIPLQPTAPPGPANGSRLVSIVDENGGASSKVYFADTSAQSADTIPTDEMFYY